MIRGNATGTFKVVSGEVQATKSIADTGRVALIDGGTATRVAPGRKQNASGVDGTPISFNTTDFRGRKERERAAVACSASSLHGVTNETAALAHIDNQRFIADGPTPRFEEFGVSVRPR
jgi:hypothetical protein